MCACVRVCLCACLWVRLCVCVGVCICMSVRVWHQFCSQCSGAPQAVHKCEDPVFTNKMVWLGLEPMTCRWWVRASLSHSVICHTAYNPSLVLLFMVWYRHTVLLLAVLIWNLITWWLSPHTACPESCPRMTWGQNYSVRNTATIPLTTSTYHSDRGSASSMERWLK